VKDIHGRTDHAMVTSVAVATTDDANN